MSKFTSVEAFGKRWLETNRPLDILANNAGTGGGNDGKPKLTSDGFEMLHQVRDIQSLLSGYSCSQVYRSTSFRTSC